MNRQKPGAAPANTASQPEQRAAAAIDDIDYNLISLLRKDGRMSAH